MSSVAYGGKHVPVKIMRDSYSTLGVKTETVRGSMKSVLEVKSKLKNETVSSRNKKLK